MFCRHGQPIKQSVTVLRILPISGCEILEEVPTGKSLSTSKQQKQICILNLCTSRVPKHLSEKHTSNLSIKVSLCNNLTAEQGAVKNDLLVEYKYILC